MVFLHATDPPLLHLDLKPANVLLDANMSAKARQLCSSSFLLSPFLRRPPWAAQTSTKTEYAQRPWDFEGWLLVSILSGSVRRSPSVRINRVIKSALSRPFAL